MAGPVHALASPLPRPEEAPPPCPPSPPTFLGLGTGDAALLFQSHTSQCGWSLRTPQPWDSFPGPGLSVPFAQVTAMLASRPQSGEAWPVAGLWGKDRVNPETMGSLHAFYSLP